VGGSPSGVPVELVARGTTAAEWWAARARVAPASPGCSGQVQRPQLSPFGAVAWPAPPRRSASRSEHARGATCRLGVDDGQLSSIEPRGYKLPLLVTVP
jgi:hypothetical protein